MSGYCGKILRVNLDTGSIDSIPMRDDLRDDYLGGSGIGARLLYEMLGDDLGTIDPLDPRNPLIFMTGPFSGTTLPATARMTVNALSPLTGLWGEANVGGQLSTQVKLAGWDGIIITGASKEPVYLHVEGEEARLLPAGELWGSDTYAACDELQDRHGDGRKPAVAVIGPAGENGVLYAAIVHNKGHVFGRSGMGTVMGSKKLKGLVVRGSGKVEPADPEGYKAARAELANKMKESVISQVLNLYGTNAGTDVGHMAGDVPIKNWQQGEWYEGIAALNGAAFDSVLTGRATCYGCPVSCKRVVAVKEGPYKMAEGPGPEYETIGSFGTMCLIPDAAAVSKINERCNMLGLDTMSCGCTIAFVIDCFEKGILGSDRTGGIELNWGDADTVLQLLDMIAERKGFGADLALGSDRLADMLGGEARRYAVTVRKMELPMHDPRGYHGSGLSYATSVRGACHMSGVSEFAEKGQIMLGEIGFDDSLRDQSSEGKAAAVVRTQDYGMAFSTAAVFCNLGARSYNEQDFLNCLEGVTGKKWTLEQLMKLGRRIWTLKRAINLLRGSGAPDDRLPELVLTPLAEGGAAGSVPDIELMLKEYYQTRSLDSEGFPSPESLAELGLDDVATALERCRGK